MTEYTRYEKARIIGARALQISRGAPVMIKTDTKLRRARLKIGSGTKEYQMTKVRMATKNTTGTKIDATLSATR